MSKKPKIANLKMLFEKGKDFTLTDSQYESKTGAPLPKNKSYLKNRSALAIEAQKSGYSIEVIEKTGILKKNS